MKITEQIKPILDHVLVSDMNFGEETTESGLILRSDDGKREGVKPRWCRVWAVGPDQKDVGVGDWIFVEHARWTRGFDYEDSDGKIIDLRMVDNAGIIAVSDQKPADVYRSVAADAGSNFNFNIPG
jgi:co-chaperonin GroES (HSP10)